MSNSRVLLVIGIPYSLVAMTLLLMSLPLPLISAEFKIPEAVAGFLAGSVFIGMFIGATSFGVLADYLGRKRALELALSTLAVSTALTYFAPNWLLFVVLRVVAGIGIGAAIPLCFVYFAELTTPEKRGMMLVLLDSFWAYGWILASFFGFAVIPAYGWRAYFAVSSVPLFLALMLAHVTLRESRLYEEKREEATKEKFTEKLAKLWSKELRRTTACTWIMWFSIVYAYYSFFLWVIKFMVKLGYPLPKALWYNLLTSFAQIPGYFLAAYLVDRIGRKPTLAAFSLGTAISVIVFLIAKTATELVIGLSLICFFCLGAWGVVMTYTAEVYPTEVRGTGYGFASGFGRIAGIIGPTLTGLMLSTYGLTGVLSLIAALFTVIALVIAVLGVETAKRPLQ